MAQVKFSISQIISFVICFLAVGGSLGVLTINKSASIEDMRQLECRIIPIEQYIIKQKQIKLSIVSMNTNSEVKKSEIAFDLMDLNANMNDVNAEYRKKCIL